MYIVVHESIKQVDLYAIFFIHIKTRTEKCYFIVLCNYIIITEINLLYQAIAKINITTCISLLLYVSSNLSQGTIVLWKLLLSINCRKCINVCNEHVCE